MADQGVLAHEIAAFEARQTELASTSAGKYALVHGNEVVAIHDTEDQAISDGRKRFGYVPILVEPIITEGQAGLPASIFGMPGPSEDPMLPPISWPQHAGALNHFGPVTKVTIGMTDSGSKAAALDGKRIPAPAYGNALIDTGATFSQLDEQLIAELGLQPVGRVDTVGFDGVKAGLRYDVELVFEKVKSVQVIAGSAQLRRPHDSPIPGYDALIGRDALTNAIMTYDAIHGMITLQFLAPVPDSSHMPTHWNSARTSN